MADGNQAERKLVAPNTKEIASVKQSEKSKAPMTPRNLFLGKDGLDTAEEPSAADLGGENQGLKIDTQTRVLTPQGKQVLTSDARLHLENIKRKNKAPDQQVADVNDINVDDELHRLDAERKILTEKVK